MADDLAAFGARLAEINLTEVELAIALLWFSDHEGESEVSATALASMIHDLALRNKVNVSRLAEKLRKHSDVINGSARNSFKLKASRKTSLDEEYLPLIKRPKPKVEDFVLTSEDFERTRPYLEKLVWQINGSYQYGFYDGCAVLSRRLAETLLISVYETAGEGEAIKKADGNYMMLRDMLSVVKKGKPVKFSRNMGKDLEKIKNVGDPAAHHRTHITKQPDIDDIKIELRRVVSELMEMAGIEPKA